VQGPVPAVWQVARQGHWLSVCRNAHTPSLVWPGHRLCREMGPAVGKVALLQWAGQVRCASAVGFTFVPLRHRSCFHAS
jgi:hypothetical protein